MADEGRFDPDAEKKVGKYKDGQALKDEEDSWGKLISHLTGYPMPGRSTLFETLTSDHGGPLFRMDFQERALEDVMGDSGLMMSSGEDYDIWFFDQSGSMAQLKQARIVFEGVAHSDDGMSFTDAEGEKPNDIALKGGNEFTDYNDQKMSLAALGQYMGGPRDAVQRLLNGSTDGFSHSGLSVPKAAEVDLSSFNATAESFDRAAKFFRDHAEIIKGWEDALGKDDASWKGESADVFRNLLSKVRENYEGYVDTFNGGSDSGGGGQTVYAKSLLEGRRRVEEAGHSLLDAWFKWAQSDYYDPHRVLRYVLDEVARWSEENNISKTSIQQTYGAYMATTTASPKEGFSQDHPKFGDLATKEAWKKVGEEAVRLWNRGVDELLVPEADRVQNLLNNQFIDLGKDFTENQPKPKTTSTASDDHEKSQAEKEKEEAEKEKKEQEEKYEKDKAEAEKEEEEAKAEAEKKEEEAEKKAEENEKKMEESLGNLNGGNGGNSGSPDLSGLGGDQNGGPATKDLGSLGGLNGGGQGQSGDGTAGGLDTVGSGSGLPGQDGGPGGGQSGGPATKDLGSLGGLNGGGENGGGAPMPVGGLGGLGGAGAGGGPTRGGQQPTTQDLGSLTGLNGGDTPGADGGGAGTLDNPGGGSTAMKDDGTLSTNFPDGGSSSFNPDNGALTTTGPDGSVDTQDLASGPVTNPDGSVTSLGDDGQLSTKFPDGTEQQINPDTGEAQTTDPDGKVTETSLSGLNGGANAGGGLGAGPGLNDGGDAGGQQSPNIPTSQDLGNLTGLNGGAGSGSPGLGDDGGLSVPDGAEQQIDPDTGEAQTTGPDGKVTETSLSGLNDGSSSGGGLPGSGSGLSGSGSDLGLDSGAGSGSGAGGSSDLGGTEGASPDSDLGGGSGESGGSGAAAGSGASGGGQGGMPMMPPMGGGMGGGGGGGDKSHNERVRSVLTDAADAAKRRERRKRGGSGQAGEDTFLQGGRRPTTTSSGLSDDNRGGPFGGGATTSSGGPGELLEEDEDVWGTDEGGAPAVIGR